MMTALLLLCAPAFALGEGEAYPFCASAFAATGYPVPEVPASERVEDRYFKGAVMIGDSLASAFDVHGVVPKLQLLTDIGLSPRTAVTPRIFRMSGEKHKVSLLKALSAMKPRVLYLWLGANGLNIKNEERVLADYEQLLNYLLPQYPDALVYLISATPIRDHVSEKFTYFTNKRVVAYNEGLRELAARHNVYYLDFHSLLVNPQGEVIHEYGTGDGIHLRARAYDLLADYLYTHTIPLEEIP